MSSQATLKSVATIIPALNEEESIGLVLQDLPDDVVDEVIVVDNGSTDKTAEIARRHGATILHEPERGYGAACHAGLEYALERGYEVVLFLDADYSDHPEQADRILRPIFENRADMVIGSRMRGVREPGAMLPQAIFGNWLATSLIALFWRVRFTDLGPFRAITAEAIRRMKMEDRNYGWTVEMQIKAARLGLRSAEVPVDYRRRRGTSKISGTIRGSFKAGVKILWWIFRERIGKTAR